MDVSESINLKPSTTGGALKCHMHQSDDYQINLRILWYSLKSLNSSKPKHRNQYIEF
jgi:hypothetical protein